MISVTLAAKRFCVAGETPGAARRDSARHCLEDGVTILPDNADDLLLLGTESGPVVELGTGKYFDPHPVLTADLDIQQISYGQSHWVARAKNGDVFVSGDNTLSQLGGGLPISVSDMTKIDFNAAFVAAGTTQTFLINSQGELYGAGMNAQGSMGVGSSAPQLDFTRIRF